jgi:glycerol-3-phosphate acyltransferase PlsY
LSGFSYLLGSIPFGIIISKYIKGIDIRGHGSGNIGATNVFRILGARPASMVLIGDVAKGMIAVLLGKVFGDSIWIFVLCGIFALLGHIWPITLKFSGGKGVATTLGVLLIMLPGIALIMLFIWVIILAVSKYVSLASIASAVVLPFIVLIFFGLSPYLLFCLFATALCLYKHKSNIQRLLRGEEYKIGQRVG